MNARESILESIRTALRDAPEAPAPTRSYRFSSGKSRAELHEQLVDRLVDYRAEVFEADTEEEVARIVAERLVNAASVVVPAGLDPAYTRGLDVEVHRDSPESALGIEQLDTMSAVVTESAAACAETGTIILDGSADQGRRAITLVPDHHVCIVRMENVRGLLPETLALLDHRRPLTWISGPSATSDIELERVEGVHGPRTLDVILVG